MGFYLGLRVRGTMASTLAAVYALAFPALGALTAITMTQFAWSVAKGREKGMAFDDRLKGMRSVLLVLPVTLIVFGIAVFFLISSASGDTAAAVLEVAAFAFGASAIAAGLAEAIILWYGVGALQKDVSSFNRTIVLAVVPELGALFALVIAVMILSGARGQVAISAQFLAANWNAAVAATGAGLAAAIGGVLTTRVEEMHTIQGWKKGLERAVPTVLIALLLFALAFLSLPAA